MGAWKENTQINTVILLIEQFQHNYSYIKTVIVRHQQCHYNAYIKGDSSEPRNSSETLTVTENGLGNESQFIQPNRLTYSAI